MEKTPDDDPKEVRRTEKKGLIQIPSYQEVFGISGGDGSSSSQPYNPPPPSSFSQAFSFIKSSEFYTPPPPMEQAPREASDSAAASSFSSHTSISASNSYPSTSSSAQNRNAILVSHRQKGNPLLKHIRNVKWAFVDIVCDYLLGQSSCALYLSLRYHLLHPDYLYYRIRELPKVFKLRVILCHIDVVRPLECFMIMTLHTVEWLLGIGGGCTQLYIRADLCRQFRSVYVQICIDSRTAEIAPHVELRTSNCSYGARLCFRTYNCNFGVALFALVLGRCSQAIVGSHEDGDVS